MNQEDKQLLLIDLCARLPYGVICDIYNEKCTITEKLLIGGLSHFCDDTIAVRPYLRPMSSMTEEERFEYLNTCGNEMDNAFSFPRYSGIDWLNAHHFDYRGLIPKGLAIEVTDKNSLYKE